MLVFQNFVYLFRNRKPIGDKICIGFVDSSRYNQQFLFSNICDNELLEYFYMIKKG